MKWIEISLEGGRKELINISLVESISIKDDLLTFYFIGTGDGVTLEIQRSEIKGVAVKTEMSIFMDIRRLIEDGEGAVGNGY